MAADAATVFAELGRKFAWDEALTTWMTAADGLAATRIEDFLFAAANEAEIGAMVNAAGCQNKIQQTSRARQAWHALRKSQTESEVIKRKGMDDTDLDAILPQPELDSLADRFWSRYHVTYPPEVNPSDLVLSRLSREISKRMLSVRDVWKIKTQSHQSRAEAKRTRISDQLEFVHIEYEPEERGHNDLQDYLKRLFTLMVAYAKVGPTRLANAPLEEPRGVDSVTVVECPLDVMMRYYFRAQERTSHQPQRDQLEWLIRRDIAEREAWVDAYRNSDAPLGVVVLKCFREREALWLSAPPAPVAVRGGQETTVPPSVRDRPRGGKGSADRDRRNEAPKGADTKPRRAIKVAERFRDGTRLCKDYQRDRCNKSDCKDKHSCGGISKSGRPCGQRHPACKCTNPQVPRE